MKKNILLAFSLSIVCTIAFAQNGPAGVGETDGSEIHGWYKSDDLAAGGLIMWPDQSGNDRDLSQVITTQQPEVITDQWGGNPLVRFDGTDDFLSNLVTGLDDVQDYTFIAYWQYTDVTTVGGGNNNSFFSSTTAGSGANGNFQIAKTNVGTFRPTADVGSLVFSSSPFTSITDRNSLMMRRANVSGTRTIDLSVNGQAVVSETIVNQYRGFDRFKFGVNRNNTRFLSFDMSEFILYDKALEVCEQIIVSNYLSSKYGGTLTADKVYEGGDQIPVYNGEVAGIGRISNSDQHRRAQGTGLLDIQKTGTGLGNDEFLMWGHNKEDISVAEEVSYIPDTAGSEGEVPVNQLTREWYFSEQDRLGAALDIGNIRVRFDLSDLSTSIAGPLAAAPMPSEVVLIIDDDGTYGSGTTIYRPHSISGSVVRFDNVSVADGSRLTIGSTSTTNPIGNSPGTGIAVPGYEGPGGVGTVDGSTLALWLRADLPSSINDGAGGTTITKWDDLSGDGNDVSTTPFLSVTPDAPSYGVESMNGLPVVGLDGVDDMLVSTGITESPGDDYSFIMVWKSTEDVVGDYMQFQSVFSSSIINSGVSTFQLGVVDNPVTQFGLIDGIAPAVSNSAGFANIREDHILTFTRNDSNVYNHWINNDGIETQTGMGTSLAEWNQFKFGVNRNNNNFSKANLAESIIVKADISSLERTIINNYLSAKYDITLAADQDIYKGDTAAGDYDFDVAGLGNDGVNTKTDARGTGLVRFSAPSNLDTDEYFMWGASVNNTGTDAHTYTRPMTGDVSVVRLDTKWFVTESDGATSPTAVQIGDVKISIDLSQLDFGSLDMSSPCFSISLVVDQDATTFATIEQTIPLVISGDFATATITDAELEDGNVFTLQYQDAIVYNGVWNNAADPGAEPNADDECFKVIFTADADFSGMSAEIFNVLSIEVEDGVTVTYPAGSQLTVSEEVNLNGTGNLRLLGNAQIIQEHIVGRPNTGFNFYNSLTPTRAINKYVNSYFSSPVDHSTSLENYIIRENIKDGRVNNLSHTYTSKNFRFEDPGVSDDSFDGLQGIPENHFTDPAPADPDTTVLNNYWIVTSTSESGGAWIERSPVSYPVPVATGIAIKHPGSDPQQYVFKGRANSGNYSVSVGSDEFYLVGNPFPSDLDADKFILDNIAAIEGDLYFLEQTTATDSHFTFDYQFSYNTRDIGASVLGGVQTLTSDDGEDIDTIGGTTFPGEDIAMGQGFFVQGDASGGLITFKNDQRVFNKAHDGTSTGGSFFFRTNTIEEESEIESLHIGFGFDLDEDRHYHRDLAITFKDGNTLEEKNKGYDSRIFDLNPSDAYFGIGLTSYDADDIAETNDEKLVIAGVEAVHNDLMIPLTVELDEDREVAFTVDQIEGVDRTKIHLYDTVTDEYLPMSGREIKKSLTAGSYTDRFFIAFQSGEVLSTQIISERDFIYKVSNDKLEVFSSKYEIESMRLVDITGKQVSSTITGEDIFDVSNLSKGIYIVKINTNEGSTTLKVVI